ncbi:response regulator transcription factor [Nitratifractor sp.]
MGYSILLVEDDRLFNETLCDHLEEAGHKVCGIFDSRSALEACYKRNFDLYLLDINLPYEDGLSLLHSLRESGDETPTIFLTSREDHDSLLCGLRYGADDYLRKPVDLEELDLRIRAVMRRHHRVERYSVDGFEIDLERRKIYREGRELDLGRKVFDLMVLLLQAGGKVVTTEEIAASLWSTAEEASYGAIRVYVTRLKKFFGDRIENIRGVGYRWVFDDETKEA